MESFFARSGVKEFIKTSNAIIRTVVITLYTKIEYEKE